jgi:hypothetical protein
MAENRTLGYVRFAGVDLEKCGSVASQLRTYE